MFKKSECNIDEKVMHWRLRENIKRGRPKRTWIDKIRRSMSDRQLNNEDGTIETGNRKKLN